MIKIHAPALPIAAARGFAASILAVFAIALSVPGGTIANAANAPSIAVQSSDTYGDFLADGSGRPLYLFSTDKQGAGYATPSSSCSGKCAAAWPPFEVSATPTAGDGAKAELIGTMTRSDGKMQATYNGWPLYTFINDKAGAEPKGEAIHAFGGDWYLVTPEGGKVSSAPD
jgi:predicted lipoprotein with Yx(FWY)xxD motif